MMRTQFNLLRWRWTLRHIRARLPWRHLNALWLLLGVAVVHGLFVYPLYAQRDELKQRLRIENMASTVHPPQAPDRQEQLAAFYDYFPAEGQMVEVLARLHEAAPRRNLSLPQGDYRLVGGTLQPLMRYEIVLPVKGNYQDVRGYVSDVLMAQPGMALDALTLTRENNARVGVDAELHFTLYVRAGR